MRRHALALLALLLLAGAAVPALASPQPSPVCGACGGSFEDVARERVETVTVTHSTAVVRFHENGSATWTVRNRFRNASTARYFREHPDRLRATARKAMRYGTIEGPFRGLSATVAVEDRTVVLTYRDAAAASRYPGGVLLTDYMHTHGYDTWPVLNVDRLTFVGPPGSAVTNSPEGATVEGRNATWTGNGSARHYEAPDAPTDAYVVFGDPGGLAGVWTALAVALATLPTVVDVLLTYHLPPLAFFGLLLAVVARTETALRRRTDLGLRQVAGTVAGLGLLAILSAVTQTVGLFGHRAILAFGVVALLVGGVVFARGADATFHDLTVAGGVGLALAVPVVLWLSPPFEFVATSAAFRRGVVEVAIVVPFVLAPVLGSVPAGEWRARVPAGLVVAAGFFVAELTVVWPTERPFGLVLVLLLALAVVVAVASLPFVLLGRVVTRDAGD